jgi:hypothetical protein
VGLLAPARTFSHFLQEYARFSPSTLSSALLTSYPLSSVSRVRLVQPSPQVRKGKPPVVSPCSLVQLLWRRGGKRRRRRRETGRAGGFAHASDRRQGPMLTLLLHFRFLSRVCAHQAGLIRYELPSDGGAREARDIGEEGRATSRARGLTSCPFRLLVFSLRPRCRRRQPPPPRRHPLGQPTLVVLYLQEVRRKYHIHTNAPSASGGKRVPRRSSLD